MDVLITVKNLDFSQVIDNIRRMIEYVDCPKIELEYIINDLEFGTNAYIHASNLLNSDWNAIFPCGLNYINFYRSQYKETSVNGIDYVINLMVRWNGTTFTKIALMYNKTLDKFIIGFKNVNYPVIMEFIEIIARYTKLRINDFITDFKLINKD